MICTIGIVLIWMSGMMACFYVPSIGFIYASLIKYNDDIGIIGWRVSWGCVAAYVVDSLVYFAVTQGADR